MYLSQIAKFLVQELASSPPESWPGSGDVEPYVVGDAPGNITAKYALDPFANSGKDQPRVFVIPGYVEYRIDKDRRRHQRLDLKYVTVCISVRVTGQDTEGFDVSTEEEITKLIDLKEDLDKFLLTITVVGAALEVIETEPPGEFQIKDSYFLATTVLGYAGC